MMVDGAAAAATMQSWTTCDPGLCLHYVWQAYKTHGAAVGGTWPTAYAAWLDTPGKHGGNGPPLGVPVWFGQRHDGTSVGAAGDVVISLGDGMCVATDWPVYGRIGVCTLAERQAQIDRPYLGWTDTILGVPIRYPQPAGSAPEPETPEQPGDDIMAYPFRVDGVHLFNVGPGFIRHHDHAAVAELTMKITSAEDKWIDVNAGTFISQLDAFGIPRNVVDAGAGAVLDPSTGQFARGGFWSWARAAYEKVQAQ